MLTYIRNPKHGLQDPVHSGTVKTATGDRYVKSVNERKVGSVRDRLENDLYTSSENLQNLADETGPDNIK